MHHVRDANEHRCIRGQIDVMRLFSQIIFFMQRRIRSEFRKKIFRKYRDQFFALVRKSPSIPKASMITTIE